jgi:hypothetical protein
MAYGISRHTPGFMRLTVFSRTSQSLAKWIKGSNLPEDHTALFTISTNVDPSHLEDMISTLGQKDNMGCMASPAPTRMGMVSCSIATFPRHSVVPFHSNLAGKEPVSLGRWRRLGSVTSVPTNGDLPADFAPDFLNLGTAPKASNLPSGLSKARSARFNPS